MVDQGTGFRVDDGRVDSMQLDGEAVLLNLHNHSYFGLNQTGTEIWGLVAENPGLTPVQVAEQVGRRYGKQSAGIRGDVEAFFDMLVREGFLTSCASVASPAIPIDSAELPYNVPRLEPFGELNTLILSGE